MAKFKVGDKVKFINKQGMNCNFPKQGEEYTVSFVTAIGETQYLQLAEKDCGIYSDWRFELSEKPIERIADLERQLETWKVIQRTNDTSIKMWQDIHQKDQRCLIHMAKQLNHVTAQSVELKRINEECAETIAMFKALNE